MDPMDYILHNPPSLPSHADHVHASPSSWMSHSHAQHVSPPSHWASHPSVVPQHFHHHHQRSHHANSHPFPLGQNGGLLLPDPSSRGFPLPDPLSGVPMHQRPWNHHFPPMPGPAAMVPPNHMGMSGSPSDMPFGLIPPTAGRNLPFQPPPAGGDMGLGPPGATSESLPLPRSLFSPSVEHSVALNQQIAASQFSVPPPHFNSSPSRRTGHHTSSTPRTPRSAIPPPSFVPLPHHHHHHHHESQGLPSPTSDRRRSGHSRARRSMNARLTMSEITRDGGDDDAGHGMHDHSASGAGHRTSQSVGNISLEDSTVRQMQVLRGALSSKMVASASALQSLQSVDINDLPENERTCVICYNDYGVETPEGISEAPLRLPKCKHVFGDHCIKKWFEDSDSCPYCRDKLHSEPKHHITSARAFMNMMRMRPLQQGVPEEMYARFMAGFEGDPVDIAPRQPQAAERRSLPDDSGESQRRTRPRRSTRDAATSTVADHPAPPTGPATATAPIRIPSREALRYPHWMVRSQAQRRSYAASNQDTDVAGHRQHGLHSRFPVAPAMANVNADLPLPNPLQAHRTDGSDGVSIGSSSAESDSNTSQTSAPAIEQQPAALMPALADQNRSRPW